MEEVQSWWEVPAVAHFCYVFRAPFNLIYFEIAELESALLNIQDPDMSLSLDQLIIRLLQGCYDEDSVNEKNWEEKLHELFNDNFDDGENIFDASCYFDDLTPRLKIEILLKLCELRLDVEGALEDIKNIPSEDMQAKCIGMDSKNNTYWYFCDERLYKENSSSGKKQQVSKTKDMKKNSNKNCRQSTREKQSKANSKVDQSWTIACFNLTDWENLQKSFSKSRNSQDKELSAAIKEHLPFLQQSIAEKDRLLRKRFLELAPKRSSSRISKVQAQRKLEELKIAEEARIAKEKAEQEKAKKEALMLKEKKESRQKRAEERSRLIEERAERAKLRELARGNDSGSSKEEEEEEDDEDSENDKSSIYGKSYNFHLSLKKSPKRRISRDEETKPYINIHLHKSNDCKNEYKIAKNSQKRTWSVINTSNSDRNSLSNSNQLCRTYSRIKQDPTNEIGNNTRLYTNPKNYQFQYGTSKGSNTTASTCKGISFKTTIESTNSTSTGNESDNVNSVDINNPFANKSFKNYSSVKTEVSSSKPNSLNLTNNSPSNGQDVNNKTVPARVAVCKSNLLQNSSDVAKWHAAFGSKTQKVHILHNPYDLTSKRIKLEQVKSIIPASSNGKSLSKENHIYKPAHQTAFITYGKIIPSPAIVKLEYRKPPNQEVSS